MRGQEMRVCERYRLGVRVRLRAAAKALVHVGQEEGRRVCRLTSGAFARTWRVGWVGTRRVCAWLGRLEGENCWSHSFIAFVRNNILSTSLLTSTSLREKMAINNKENEAYSLKIAKLQREKEYHEEILRQRCEVVEVLKKEKKRLEASVRAKEAIAAARRQ